MYGYGLDMVVLLLIESCRLMMGLGRGKTSLTCVDVRLLSIPDFRRLNRRHGDQTPCHRGVRATAVRACQGHGGSSRLQEGPPAVSFLDTCYDDIRGVEAGKTLPAVSLVFHGGASLEMDAPGILYVASGSARRRRVCVLRPTTMMTLIGHSHHREHAAEDV